MVIADEVDEVMFIAWTMEYWFWVAPVPGVPIQIRPFEEGVVSAVPPVPPEAVLPMAIVVWAVAEAAMPVWTHANAFPNIAFSWACSLN